jgi:alpha-1,3-rhamnosyltransferase
MSDVAAASKLESGRPLVTAILVCWNHVRFVRKAVESVFAQTYPNLELIVFDNGSTDGSREELRRLRSTHEFVLVCQENVGLVRALNKGLALSHGKYFACLSTDDIWLPEKTAVQVDFLERHPDVHLVAGQIESIDADGNFSAVPTVKRWGEPTFAELMTSGNYVPGPTTMCRVATLKAFGGYDESIRIEDYSLVLKLTHRGMRVVVLPDSLTLYRFHGSNWSARSLESELLEVGAPYRNEPEYPAFYRYHFPLTFWRLAKDGYKREAWRLLVSEPVPRTWANLGRGLIRMVIPYFLVKLARQLRAGVGSRLNSH